MQPIAFGDIVGGGEQEIPLSPHNNTLVEYFTADTLEPGEFKAGFELEFSPFRDFMIGTDLLATSVGAINIQSKWLALRYGEHKIAAGLRGAVLNKETLLWGSLNDHFETLDARVLNPSLSWTQKFSERLNLHTHWAVGIGKVRAKLSEKGQRKLWESKHPGKDYDSRNEDGEAAKSDTRDSFSKRTLQVQSITGLTNDLFQVTGEFQRSPNKKILITSRIDRVQIETLRSNGFRLTAAQQWIWENFQFRLGIGLQYQVISGTDLDGELMDETGFLPVSDIDFYWRF